MDNKLKAYLERADPKAPAAAPPLAGLTPEQRRKVGNAAFWGVVLLGGLVVMAVDGSNADKDPAAAPAEVAAAAAPAPGPALADQADAVMTAFKTAVEPCDAAGAAVIAATQSGSATPAEAYALAKQATAACHQSHLDLFNTLHPPEGAAKTFFAQAIETCQVAYYDKKHTYEALMDAIDGGMRPSKVAEVREKSDAANAALAVCVPAMMTAVKDAGGKQSGFDDEALTTKAD